MAAAIELAMLVEEGQLATREMQTTVQQGEKQVWSGVNVVQVLFLLECHSMI